MRSGLRRIYAFVPFLSAGLLALSDLQDVKVSEGQQVKRGTVIGTVGRTGLAQGYHLHYEVIQNGTKVNPVYYFFNDLTPAEYDEVLEASYVENQCLS